MAVTSSYQLYYFVCNIAYYAFHVHIDYEYVFKYKLPI